MSKQDNHFFNVFSAILGVLVAIAILLFVLSRLVASPLQEAQVMEDPLRTSDVAARLAPVGRVAVAGADNSALTIAPPPGAEPVVAAALPANGEETYNAVCGACHNAGIGGAPKAGDAAAWGPRIAQGKATLYKHSIEGFQGKAGYMPPKGGRADLPDELIQQAVDHMLSL